MINGKVTFVSVLSVMLLIFAVGQSLGQKKMNKDSFYKESLFTVDTAFWCSAVEEGMPQQGITKVKLGSSYFLWIKLTGKEDALDILKVRPMPVIAKWFRYASYGLTAEEGDGQYSELTTMKSNERWFAKKQAELKKEKSFAFATWTTNRTLKRTGTYYVRLVYYDNTPVQCNGIPCEYKISITK